MARSYFDLGVAGGRPDVEDRDVAMLAVIFVGRVEGRLYEGEPYLYEVLVVGDQTLMADWWCLV